MLLGCIAVFVCSLFAHLLPVGLFVLTGCVCVSMVCWFDLVVGSLCASLLACLFANLCVVDRLFCFLVGIHSACYSLLVLLLSGFRRSNGSNDQSNEQCSNDLNSSSGKLICVFVCVCVC